MGAKSKLIMGAVDALGNKIGALGDYLKEFDPKTYYHYSPEPDITKFDPKTTNDPFNEFMYQPKEEGRRGATYFTSDPEYANKIMEDIHEFEEYKDHPDSLKVIQDDLTRNQQAPTMYPVKIKTKDIFDFENPEHIKRLSDEGDVRSVFAKFDPSKSKKGEILAAVPVGALGALGATENE